MIEYFDALGQEEQDAVTDIIRMLHKQTFLLERKFDRRTGRFVYQKEYRICYKHLEFLKAYFSVSGISLKENAQMGLIYIQDESLWGEKLPRLTTIYLLILKIIYDEQMAQVSSSANIVTTMGEVNGRAGDFRVLKAMPSPTEMRRTVAMLRKYQIVEPVDILEDLNEHTRLVIYPCIQAILLGDDVKELLNTFGEEDNIGDESALQGDFESMPE